MGRQWPPSPRQLVTGNRQLAGYLGLCSGLPCGRDVHSSGPAHPGCHALPHVPSLRPCRHHHYNPRQACTLPWHVDAPGGQPAQGVCAGRQPRACAPTHLCSTVPLPSRRRVCAGAHREPVHRWAGGPPERGDRAGHGAYCVRPPCLLARHAHTRTTQAERAAWHQWQGHATLGLQRWPVKPRCACSAGPAAGHQHPRGEPVAVLHIPVHAHDTGEALLPSPGTGALPVLPAGRSRQPAAGFARRPAAGALVRGVTAVRAPRPCILAFGR